MLQGKGKTNYSENKFSGLVRYRVICESPIKQMQLPMHLAQENPGWSLQTAEGSFQSFLARVSRRSFLAMQVFPSSVSNLVAWLPISTLLQISGNQSYFTELGSRRISLRLYTSLAVWKASAPSSAYCSGKKYYFRYLFRWYCHSLETSAEEIMSDSFRQGRNNLMASQLQRMLLCCGWIWGCIDKELLQVINAVPIHTNIKKPVALICQQAADLKETQHTSLRWIVGFIWMSLESRSGHWGELTETYYDNAIQILQNFANKTCMDKILKKSRTSIEGDFQEAEELEVYREYIMMVNQKLEAMSKRQEVAEDLIEQYKIENQQLKQKNQHLQRRVSDLTEEVQYLKELLLRNNGANMQDRICDLARKNQKVEKKIFDLTQQLEKSQAKVAKLTKIKRDTTERTLQSFLQFPKPQLKNHGKEMDFAREIRSLKWKLKQKDEQIIYMIKRNKLLEEREARRADKNFKKLKDEDRFFTCETEINKSLT